jgi:nitroreductase
MDNQVLYHFMRTAPALREFTTEAIGDDVVRRVVDAARFAPSGGNLQPWRVIVVREEAKRRALRDLYLSHWEPYIEKKRAGQASAEGLVAVEVSPALKRRLDLADEFARRLDEVPLHLLVLADLTRLLMTDKDLDRPSIVGGASIYPFVQNVLLGLRAEGLSAVLTTLIVADEVRLRELFDIPENFVVAGYVLAAQTPRNLDQARLTRLPVEDVVFEDSFGAPFGGQVRSATRLEDAR